MYRKKVFYRTELTEAGAGGLLIIPKKQPVIPFGSTTAPKNGIN